MINKFLRKSECDFVRSVKEETSGLLSLMADNTIRSGNIDEFLEALNDLYTDNSVMIEQMLGNRLFNEFIELYKNRNL